MTVDTPKKVKEEGAPGEPKAKKSLKDEKKDELSEEDKKLNEDLTMLVERLGEPNAGLWLPTIDQLRNLIRASTTSMTSVPKPLKFMRPHYEKVKQIHAAMPANDCKAACADLISVLGMTSDDKNDCLKYRMIGSQTPIGDWGHEYVRHLAMELVDEWKNGVTPDGEDAKTRRQPLEKMAREIVQHHMKHNAEVEACDLLIEVERLDMLIDFVEEVEHQRVCHYLVSCSPLTPDPENATLIETAKALYLKYKKFLEAMRCAVMLNQVEEIKRIFKMTTDPLLQRQMAIILGRHQIFLDFQGLENGEKLSELNSNAHLFEYFHSLARELDIMEPKTPDQIYKSHLEHTRPFGGSSNPDTARMNLAGAFVNGFVNCGFGQDKMMAEAEEGNKWFFKNKEHGILAAAASQGLVYRWDVDTGLAQCDRFLYSNDDYVKAGTLLAVGIISSGIQDSCDPASALLLDHLKSERTTMRVGAILGLGLAYANSKRDTVVKQEDGGIIFELKKVFNETSPAATPEVKGLTGLSLGLIMVGTGDHTIAFEMLQVLMEKTEQELTDPNMRLLALGVALIFLGTQEKSEVFVESVRTLPDPFGSMFSTLVDVCAYAGSGNVLKIQQLLHICSEHYETPVETKAKKKEEKKQTTTDGRLDLSSQQAVAVLGVAIIAMGEDVGSQMALRMFSHLIRYGEPVIRRAVPLALGLLSVSNPQLNILETLGKFSHDSDSDTAHNAIFAMGLVGAGTNNARLVAMLRQLASYHNKDQISLELVRISQGLTHLGKGTLTLNPWHSDRQLLCPASVASLFATCFFFLDANNTVLSSRQPYLLYTLVSAMQPRMLVTLVEDDKKPGQLKQIPVTVRVGQAVDVVAQAGKPKTITGFQTHTTPVLLSFGERAELANEEWIALTPHLEGLVILKKNPEYDASQHVATTKNYSGLEYDSEPAEQLAVGIGLAIHIIILLLIPMTLINLFVPDLVHGPCNHEGCRERDVLNHGVSDSGEFDPLLDSDDDEEEDDDPEHEHENEHEHDYSDNEDKDLIPHRLDDRERRQIGYYQWVPFVLALAALMFHIPSSVWRLLAPQSGLNAGLVLQLACQDQNVDPTHRDQAVGIVARHIDDALVYQRDHGSRRKNIYIFAVVRVGKFYGAYVSSCYIFIKSLHLINVGIQFVLLNSFLGTADYPLFGAHVLYDLFMGREWRDSGKFPRVTLCDFEIRVLGNVHRHTVQCVLVINMFTEKIFVFLWVWLSALAFLTAINLFFWLCALSTSSLRQSFVSKHLDMESEQLARFTDRFLRPDGVFLLHMIANHAGNLFCSKVTQALWQIFLKRSGKPVLEEKVEGSEADYDAAQTAGNGPRKSSWSEGSLPPPPVAPARTHYV
ncbi:unnamed protein product, partial [Mesorhabditis spiculigera]